MTTEQAAQPEEEMEPREEYPEGPQDDAANRPPDFALVDLSNARIFTPAEMKAKGKRFAEEAQRTQAGKNLKWDNVRLVDPAAVKALARKLYTTPGLCRVGAGF